MYCFIKNVPLSVLFQLKMGNLLLIQNACFIYLSVLSGMLFALQNYLDVGGFTLLYWK